MTYYIPSKYRPSNMNDGTNFTATQWDTVEEKEKFLTNLIRFVHSGFDRKLWNKSLYKRLSLCFQHIAHYDQEGFWSTWFSDKDQQQEWVSYILRVPIYGDPAYTYSDVERVFQKWLRAFTPEQLEIPL